MPETGNAEISLNLEKILGINSKYFYTNLKYSALVKNGLQTSDSFPHSIFYSLKQAIIKEELVSGASAIGKQKLYHMDVENIACFAIKRNLLAVGEASSQNSWAKVSLLKIDESSDENIDCIEEFSHKLHLIHVEAVDVSCNGEYVASLGGKDDSSDSLRIWRVLAELDCNKYSYEEINCRNTAKHISALEFSKDGKILFFATKSGQIGQVDVEKSVLISILNSKFENLRLGSITLLSLVKSQSENSKINSKNDHELIVTCTNGSIKAFTLECEDTSSKRYEIKNLKHKNHNIDNDYVNSICHRRNSVLFGTKNGQVIIFDSDLDEKPQAVRENFLHSIKALEFPNQTDEILMIAAGRKIVLIYLPDFSLKCEIQVSNCDCEISKFSPDGSLILSGWSDGTVRAFTPKSGKEWFIIENAHKDSVTQLAVASEMDLIISGGADGLVRLWEVFSEGKTKTVPRLKHSLHAHRDTISSIEMSHNNECCLTASHDGTCIIWSLKTLSAQKVMFTNAIFKAALFEPITLSQILTCSSDGMLIFWQCGSGEKIREIKAVDGSINDVKFLKENNKEIELFKKLEISYEKDNINNEKEIQEIFSNQKFVTVDSLKYLKVWSYKSGAVLTSSSKHSAKIKRMAVNSKGSMIVTGCEDGSIYIWKMK